MTKSKYIFALIFSILFSTTAFAGGYWQTNQIVANQKAQAFEKVLFGIPIYRDKLTGTYDNLGFVHSEDALTNKKDAMIYQMRFQAYKMGANAIMEFKCRGIKKSIFQQCEGFAVSYKGELP